MVNRTEILMVSFERAIKHTLARYYSMGMSYAGNKYATDAFLKEVGKQFNQELKHINAGFQIKSILGQRIT